jgi:hypothetical protein
MKIEFIYPNIRYDMIPLQGCRYHLILETWLRKRKPYTKQYYFIHFFREAIVADHDELAATINHFHAEVYRGLILTIIDLKLIYSEHPWEPVYERDKSSEPESERLIPKK